MGESLVWVQPPQRTKPFTSQNLFWKRHLVTSVGGLTFWLIVVLSTSRWRKFWFLQLLSSVGTRNTAAKKGWTIRLLPKLAKKGTRTFEKTVEVLRKWNLQKYLAIWQTFFSLTLTQNRFVRNWSFPLLVAAPHVMVGRSQQPCFDFQEKTHAYNFYVHLQSKKALKNILQKCVHLPALEPLLHEAPANVLKHVVGQYSKVSFFARRRMTCLLFAVYWKVSSLNSCQAPKFS